MIKFTRKAQEYFDNNIGIRSLFTVFLALLVVFMLMITGSFWMRILGLARAILLPFILGFAFAYIVVPITRYLERFKIPRALSVLIVVILVILFIGLLFSAVIPSLINDISKFGQNIVDGVQQLYNLYIKSSDQPSEIVANVYTEVINMVTGFSKEVPTYITGILSGTVSVFTTFLFSFIIGIYFVFDYEKFTRAVGRIAYSISPKLYMSIKVVDEAVKRYLRTQMVIILASFIEYTLIYTIVGHNYAFVLGVLTAISMLVPYIGPTIIHAIGILTCLTLGIPKTLILTALLVIMSQVDGYVVAPMIYSKRDKVEPLWSLFSFFACSTLFGFIGVLASMPLYFSIHSLIRLRANGWKLETEQSGSVV